MEAAGALGMPEDERTWKVARSLVDHALDWGWDEEHGGFYDKGESFAGNAFDTTKVWWTEAEGLNALMVMHTEVWQGNRPLRPGVSQAVGLHPGPHARPEVTAAGSPRPSATAPCAATAPRPTPGWPITIPPGR